jgi:hypothetical protein
MTNRTAFNNLLKDQNNLVYIISGEGTGEGHREKYHDVRTITAIKNKLTRERCNGDRWAKAIITSHVGKHGQVVYLNFDSCEYC